MGLVWKLLMFACVLNSCQASYHSKVALNNNGYEGILVTIDKSIPGRYCQDVLMGLENLIQESSAVVFQATRRRAYFKDISVLVPSSWSTIDCPLLQGKLRSAAKELESNADIRVTTGRHPDFGSLPWTSQSQGCAMPGDYISFSSELLYQNDSISNGRLLAHNWLKYRYGVFDEIGISDGHGHQSTHRAASGEWEYSVCSNVPLEKGHLCRREDASCPNAIPFMQKTPGLKTSFMAFPESSSVTELCDEGSHNPSAPTPHNLICDSKSVWEVLRASVDFQNNRNVESRAQQGEIAFNYVQSMPPRMVLTIEDTSIMNMQKRWDFMRKAIRKLVIYDVPDSLRVGLVVFDSEATVKYPLTPLSDVSTRTNLGSSLPRNPSNEDRHNRCVICGLRSSLQLLRQNGETSGHIVLTVAESSKVSPQEMEDIRILMADTNVVLHVIVYPLTNMYPTPNSGIEALASHTGGLAFTIQDEGIGADSKIVMYYNLLDSLYSVLEVAAGENVLPVKVHSAEHEGGLKQSSEGTFWLDPGLGSDTVFAVFYYDLSHVGDTIHLTSPQGQVIDTDNMQQEDDNMNMIVIRLRKNQEIHGLWKYNLENRANSHQSLFVQVTSRPRDSKDASRLKVSAWSSENREVNATDISNPLVIFTEVRIDLAPVKDAVVTAILTRLGHTSNGTEHSPVVVHLLDNGLLGPDIRRGDGIYSRTVNGLSSGKYTAKVHIEGRVGEFKFTRQLLLGSVNVIGDLPSHDVISPARITDLRSAVLAETEGQISFTWTAPGDSYDVGRATKYEVFLSENFGDLKYGSSTPLNGWPVPMDALSMQQHTISWEDYDRVYYVALRAVDENGNVAHLSNVVEIFLPTPPAVSPSTVVSHPAVLEKSAIANSISGMSMGGIDTKMAIILGCVGLVVLIIILTMLYCASSNRSKKSAVKRMSDNLSSVSLQIEKPHDTKKDFLTPPSWSPSELLGNHHLKSNSISGRSDNNSDHSGSTKKSYGGSSEPPQYYSNGVSFPDGYGYPETYYMAQETYPAETTTQNQYPLPEGYVDSLVVPPELRSYVSSHPSESFLSESCDMLPGSQGPPGYSAYPTYEGSLREVKIPPPIPPKPKVAYTPEPYLYDNQEFGSNNSSSASMTSEKRVRNVTMV